MTRKIFLIQLFILLFTFQNIWSVAEAACLHEMSNDPNSRLMNPNDSTELSKNTQQISDSLADYNKIYDYCQKVCFNEKCNHFSNTIVLQIHPPDDLLFKTNFQITIIPSYLGITFYLSPVLNQLTPPPNFSPLLVG